MTGTDAGSSEGRGGAGAGGRIAADARPTDRGALAPSRTVTTRAWPATAAAEGESRGSGAGPARGSWQIAVETPVEIAIDGEPVAVVIATPVDLADLVRGFLLTEGFVGSAGDIAQLDLAPLGIGIAARVTTTAPGASAAPAAPAPPHLAGSERGPAPQRAAQPMASGSGEPATPGDEPAAARRTRILASRGGCGVCGVTRLDQAIGPAVKVRAAAPIDPQAVARAFAGLPDHQPLNADTHSVHAAALARRDGTIVFAREDVGRHNALDKLIGALAAAGQLPADGFVVMSSRCSYELVQKASIAGAPLLATISAPTTLAVDTARAAGIKLAARGPSGEVIFVD